MIKREIHVFFTALMFYTRIPVPWKIPYSPEILNRTTRYLTLVGIIVGCAGASIFYLADKCLPVTVALILSMAATILVTGAFHEDGFADFCDGFGGGYTKEKTLEIMKDSSIGTYGAIGLVLMLLVKFYLLTNIPVSRIPLILISAHALSRMVPVCIIYTSRYVRKDELSKTKPIGQKGSANTFIVASFFAIIFLCFFNIKAVLIIVAILFVYYLLFRNYIHHKIGGYTGDVLGASQQIAEIGFYLGYLIWLGNI